MDDTLMKDIIYQTLPADVYGKAPQAPGRELLSMVERDVGSAIFSDNKNSLVFRLPLQAKKITKKRIVRNKKKHITKKCLKANNLNRLPKNGWSYAGLAEMRQMWAAYMRKCLSATGTTAPEITDNNYAQFHSTLAKVELVGANVKVVQSRTPSNVGVEGTIVLETQQTFQVVTPSNQLKILLKPASIFVIQLDNIEFRIPGQSLLQRPHERVVKKFKAFIKLDL